jgi:Mn2+/Fe2+ NRAMP family transporter
MVSVITGITIPCSIISVASAVSYCVQSLTRDDFQTQDIIFIVIGSTAMLLFAICLFLFSILIKIHPTWEH